MTTLTAPAPTRPSVGPGRPRHTGPRANAGTPRDEILDHSARLFVDRSFSGTSTREIAEACGIRQASLYYHFSSKHEILAELLQMSVRPSLDRVEEIEQKCAADVPEVALYLLTLVDVRTLVLAPHNSGLLHRMPDVRSSDAFHDAHRALQALTHAYGRLGSLAASNAVTSTVEPAQLGSLLIGVVESVVGTRARGGQIGPAEMHAIAASCLRVCGVPDEHIARVAASAEVLLPTLTLR